MRRGIIIIAALTLSIVGCASHPKHSDTVGIERTYQPQLASALVFDPPISAGVIIPDLSRDNRGPSAFFGFQQGEITFYDLHVEDRQSGGQNDRYRRDAISDKIGTILR
jgi:hypothetical protein